MERTNGASRESCPFRIVPERGKVSQNSSEKPSGVISGKSGVMAGEDAGDVFTHHPAGPKFANNSGELGPEVTLVVAAPALAREGVGTAWPPSANNINGAEIVDSDIAHVLVFDRLWEVFRVDKLGVFLVFNLPAHVRAAQAPGDPQAQPAHASEQFSDGVGHSSTR